MEIHASLTVQETLHTLPQAAEAFLALRTDCVGCPLERFCTLEEVAQAYGLPPETLLQRLGEVVQCPHKEDA